MLKISRFALASVLVAALSKAMAQTAPPATPPNAPPEPPPLFAAALAAAWAKHPASRSAGAARDAVSAQQSATTRWLADPASLSLGYRADKPLGSGQGAREAEAEIALPLWRPGQRDAAQRAAQASALQLDARLLLQRWQLAGELRDAWWEARLAQTEVELSAQQLASASALAADVERRVKTGDLARLDLNQARSAEQAARIASDNAVALKDTSLRLWATLTGLPALPLAPETVAPETVAPETVDPKADSAANAFHPSLVALQTRAALAAAIADKARSGRYASPEVSISMNRERGASGEAYGRSTRIGLRIPLGSNTAAEVDALQALTDKAEIEAELAQQVQQLVSAQAMGRQDLKRRNDALRMATERLRLTDDTLALQQRAFRLGHIDLPTRLRAQTERAEVALQAARADIELQRAASRLNQALGRVP